MRALIAGLGNPGPEYRDTWHNLGFMVVDELARRWKVAFKAGRGDYFKAEAAGRRKGIVLIKPSSFMNRSGEPIGQALRHYNVALSDLLVVFDDHDLPFGRLRLRESGSSGGHHGLDDIIYRLGTDDFPRLRIGIDDGSGTHGDITGKVLSIVPTVRLERLEKVVAAAADAVEMFLDGDIKQAMTRYNRVLIE